MNLQTLILKQGTLYDLLFVGKNKEYGAYYNRQVYPEHLKKALLFYFSFIFIISFSLWGYSRYKSINTITEYKVDKKVTIFQTYTEPKRVEPPTMKKEVTAAPKDVNTVAVVPPTIEHNVINSEPIETVKEILKTDAAIGNVTNESKNNEPSTDFKEPTSTTNSSIGNTETKKVEILDFAEIDPEFPGGEDALKQYLGDMIRYPNFARDNELEGIVNIEFIVNEDGSISNVKALNIIEGGFVEEATRVIKKMPKWSPGKNGGHFVKVRFIVPVNFKLQP